MIIILKNSGATLLRPNFLMRLYGAFLRLLKILFENIGEKFFHVVP